MATYTFTTTDDQEIGISDARSRYNAANLATPIEDNQTYLTKFLNDTAATWEAASVHATMSAVDRAKAAAILEAAVALGDENSATAAALLQKLQGAS